jgi:hypothetical protein
MMPEFKKRSLIADRTVISQPFRECQQELEWVFLSLRNVVTQLTLARLDLFIKRVIIAVCAC